MGAVTKHQVPLDWRSDAYEQGIRYVEEPEFEDDLTQYVLFGDIAIMQLTFNHIESLYKWNPLLAGYLLPEERKTNRLVIPFVMPGSYAGEFLMPGDIVRKVNGHEVFTLEDFKTHFLPDELRDSSEAPAPAPCDQATEDSSSATADEIKAAVEAAVAEAMKNLQNGQNGTEADMLLATATKTSANASLPAEPAEKPALQFLQSEPKAAKTTGFLQAKTKVRPSAKRASLVKAAAVRKLKAKKVGNESAGDESGGDAYGDEYGDESGIFEIPMDTVEEPDTGSDEGKVVWTPETEGGHIYA